MCRRTVLYFWLDMSFGDFMFSSLPHHMDTFVLNPSVDVTEIRSVWKCGTFFFFFCTFLLLTNNFFHTSDNLLFCDLSSFKMCRRTGFCVLDWICHSVTFFFMWSSLQEWSWNKVHSTSVEVTEKYVLYFEIWRTFRHFLSFEFN